MSVSVENGQCIQFLDGNGLGTILDCSTQGGMTFRFGNLGGVSILA
jgi:hypothetical protein